MTPSRWVAWLAVPLLLAACGATPAEPPRAAVLGGSTPSADCPLDRPWRVTLLPETVDEIGVVSTLVVCADRDPLSWQGSSVSLRLENRGSQVWVVDSPWLLVPASSDPVTQRFSAVASRPGAVAVPPETWLTFTLSPGGRFHARLDGGVQFAWALARAWDATARAKGAYEQLGVDLDLTGRANVLATCLPAAISFGELVEQQVTAGNGGQTDPAVANLLASTGEFVVGDGSDCAVAIRESEAQARAARRPAVTLGEFRRPATTTAAAAEAEAGLVAFLKSAARGAVVGAAKVYRP